MDRPGHSFTSNKNLLCDGPNSVGDALEALAVSVALAYQALNADRVVASLED